jgi:predicted GNAT family acetyltransferase
MEVVFHPDGGALLARIGARLEEAEAENNLALGIAASPAAPPPNGPQPLFATVEDAGAPEMAAVWTPPWNLCVTRGSDAALAALATELRARKIAPPGVVGPADVGEKFAALFAPKFRVAMRQRIYQLDEVIAPRPVAGTLRVAGDQDLVRLAEWIRAFAADAALPAIDPESSVREARRRIDAKMTYLWRDDDPVSLAAAAGPTAHGIRINLVYTPPERRKRGYASALVAALSQRMLDEGRRFCFLYTDLANPTSNGIYQAIGYRPVADAIAIRFD